MAVNPDNIFQQVATYQDPSLAYLDNFNVFIPNLNTKYLNLQDLTAQLGTTVNLELPYRYRAANGLVIAFTPTQQRLHPLTVMQAKHVATAFSEQQFIYNAEKFMDKLGIGMSKTLSNAIEINVALNATSHVPVMTLDDQGQSIPTGALKVENGPFRFYGNGINPINSFTQLAEMEAFFLEYGAPATGDMKVFLPNMAVPAIIGDGANQFVLDRNEAMTKKWMVGDFGRMSFARSNLLPTHTAGSAGDDQLELTVVSINDAGNLVTVSGAGTASKAVRSGDLAQFLPSADINFLTFEGYNRSQCPVQIRALADADSSADSMTISITPNLVSDSSSANQNINKAIVAGMKLKFVPSHKAGLVSFKEAFFLAMPQLGKKVPYPSSNKMSDLTGISTRHYYGHVPFGNTEGYVNDCIFDTALLQDYCMRMVFPL